MQGKIPCQTEEVAPRCSTNSMSTTRNHSPLGVPYIRLLSASLGLFLFRTRIHTCLVSSLCMHKPGYKQKVIAGGRHSTVRASHPTDLGSMTGKFRPCPCKKPFKAGVSLNRFLNYMHLKK